jgi:oligoribonuclease
MMADKDAAPTKLLWVDLEMTGLDPVNDLILEIAAVVTDFDFHELARYEARVSHQKQAVLERMEKNAWWASYPQNRDDFIQNLDEGKALGVVEQALVTLVAEQFGSEPAILAGNSIHEDRKFIAHWWPRLEQQLHYRMLDVTSLKIYMRGKYDVEFKKKEVHRAFDDIQESMAEWQYYMGQLRQERG